MSGPIAYDYHDRSLIELYYCVDGRTGKSTCMAACEHCFLRSNAHVNAFRQDISEAVAVMAKLRANGYRITPVLSETFTGNGEYLRAGVLGGVEFILGKMAWTSGMPLVKGDHRELLQLAVDAGMEIVALTSHGVEDGDSPMRGVVPPSIVREAVHRIQSFNAERSQSLRISLTFTVGAWNFSRERIKSYLDYCEALGVDMLRLNNFCDHQHDHADLRLDRPQIEAFYAMVKELNGAHVGKLRLSVSEDFGFWGVDVMGFPERVGDCAAGENLFGVVYPEVYACPQLCSMRVGSVTDDGRIQWDDAMMARLSASKRRDDYNGCLATSLAMSSAFAEALEPTTKPRRLV